MKTAACEAMACADSTRAPQRSTGTPVGGARAAQRPTTAPAMQFSLTDCLRTHVLGWHSFAYSADPRRSSLQDAATEVRESCLRDCARVCRSWRGFVEPVLARERRRFVDETHLLRDARVHPLVNGVHLAPCSFQATALAAKRFTRLPFKDGDVALVDCEALQKAAQRLAIEHPTHPVLQRVARATAFLAARLPRCRMRIYQCHAVGVPRGLERARGPGGLVLVEVGAPPRVCPVEASPSEDMLLHDTLELDEQIPMAAAALPLFPPSPSGWRFSLPLPLLEPGVLRHVVPCAYRPISKSRWPFAFGSLKGRPQLPLGVVATRTARGAGQVLVVRDARNGASATGDAATWGMEAWARGELVLGAHEASPEAAPAAQGHLVLEPVPDLDALEGRLAPAFHA